MGCVVTDKFNDKRDEKVFKKCFVQFSSAIELIKAWSWQTSSLCHIINDSTDLNFCLYNTSQKFLDLWWTEQLQTTIKWVSEGTIDNCIDMNKSCILVGVGGPSTFIPKGGY